MDDPDDGLSAVSRAYRAAAPWMSLAWQFVGSAMVGVGVGYAVDAWRGTKPWGLLVGGLLGSVMGLYVFIRNSLRLLEKKP